VIHSQLLERKRPKGSWFKANPGKVNETPISTNNLGMVMDTYNPSTQEVEIRRITVRGQPRQKESSCIKEQVGHGSAGL
jgi:hypothetical protein